MDETRPGRRRSISTGVRSCNRLCSNTLRNSFKETSVGGEKKMKIPMAASITRTSNKVRSVRSSKVSSSTVGTRKLKVSAQETVTAESNCRQEEHGDEESGLISSHAKMEFQSTEVSKVSESSSFSAKLNSKKEQNPDVSSSNPVRKITKPSNAIKASKSSQKQGSLQRCGLGNVRSSCASDASSGTCSTNPSPKNRINSLQGKSSLGGEVTSAKTGTPQTNGLRNLRRTPASVTRTSKLSSDCFSTKSMSKIRIDSSATRSQSRIGSSTIGMSVASTEVVKKTITRVSPPQSVSQTIRRNQPTNINKTSSSATQRSESKSRKTLPTSEVSTNVNVRTETRTTKTTPTSGFSSNVVARTKTTIRKTLPTGSGVSNRVTVRREAKSIKTTSTSGISNNASVSKHAIKRPTMSSNKESTYGQGNLRWNPPCSTRITRNNNNNYSNRRRGYFVHGCHRVYSDETSQLEEEPFQEEPFQEEPFRRGYGYYDEHRDMRMDIDGMSYEELLALGERMGTVSTALSEEDLSNCLKRSTYEHESANTDTSNSAKDDNTCSICQEEYVADDEVGKLSCEHLYHVDCIHQWLRQKNWCPICKSDASPSLYPC